MGNLLKSKKSGMVGYRVPDLEIANFVLAYFLEKGTTLAWINMDSYGIEVLIAEIELKRINVRYTDVTIDIKQKGFGINWPAIYGDPHFSFK